MKRILFAAALLAATSPALAQNTKAENDVAGAAVMFMTSDKCNLPPADRTHLKAITDRIIEANGWTWEQLRTGRPIIGHFLKEHPAYERMSAPPPAAHGGKRTRSISAASWRCRPACWWRWTTRASGPSRS